MIETRRKFQEREKERSASKKKKKKKRYSHSSFLTCSHLSCSRAKKRVERVFFFPISRYPGYINRNTDGKMLCGSIYCVCMCVCKCVICVYMTENKREKSSPTVLPTRFLLENVNIGKDFARQSHQWGQFPNGRLFPPIYPEILSSRPSIVEEKSPPAPLLKRVQRLSISSKRRRGWDGMRRGERWFLFFYLFLAADRFDSSRDRENELFEFCFPANLLMLLLTLLLLLLSLLLLLLLLLCYAWGKKDIYIYYNTNVKKKKKNDRRKRLRDRKFVV